MKIVSITATTFPYDRGQDLYQQYYRSGLRDICAADGIAYSERSHACSDSLLRKARNVKHSYKLGRIFNAHWFHPLVDRIASLLTRGPLHAPAPVGSYEFLTDTGVRFTICIDSHDAGYLHDNMLETADLYFKSNYWPSIAYPSRVVPIANLNPLVGSDRPYFRGLRDTPKTLDLFAFFRIWGGDDEVKGIEHNLRLIESLAKVECTKFLCAYLVAGDIAAIGQRLDRQGIQWTTEPLTPRQLWVQAAAARLNIVRLGMHECIPWRMTDILAMGGCPVIDYGPRTLWPSPLIEEQHFLSLRALPDTPPPEELPGRVAAWLAHPTLIADISCNTAAYFDRHLEPIEIGRDILLRTGTHLQDPAI